MKKLTNNFLQISYFISSNIFTTPTYIHSHKKRENGSVNIKFLIRQVASRNHVLKDSCGFMGGSFSQEVTIL